MAGVQERRRPAGRDEAGFTLIELLVVASILMVLAGMGLVQSQERRRARARKRAQDRSLQHARRDRIVLADKGQYPGTLDDLTSSGYLRRVPDDPFTLSNTTWLTIPSEPDPNNPSAAPGCLRHQEQRRRHGARRHQILRLVDANANLVIAQSGNRVIVRALAVQRASKKVGRSGTHLG